MARYEVAPIPPYMLASIKELEEEDGRLSPEARVEYRPRTGSQQQATQPHPSSARATAHNSSQDVALTYSSQDAVTTGGRVFSARPQSASATRSARATGYLHSLDAQDTRGRPQSAGRPSGPDRPLAYGRQRPASATTVRPGSFEVVYGVELPPGSGGSGSHERRRRRAKRGGAQPEWNASMTCPRAAKPLAAYTAGRDPFVFGGFPRKYGDLPPSVRQDEPVRRGPTASRPSAPLPGAYAYGNAPPPPPPPPATTATTTSTTTTTTSTTRTRPASAPSSRAHASGANKPQWGSRQDRDPTRREALTVVTRHGGLAQRPSSAGRAAGQAAGQSTPTPSPSPNP